MSWASNHQCVGEALRLHVLGQEASYHNVLTMFKGQSVSLTPNLACAIADIGTQLFKLTHEAKPKIWEAFVTNVCEGWALRPKEGDSSLALVQGFEHAIVRQSVSPVQSRVRALLQVAFLMGLKFALSERMAAYKAERYKQIEDRSPAVVCSLSRTASIDIYNTD